MTRFENHYGYYACFADQGKHNIALAQKKGGNLVDCLSITPKNQMKTILKALM
jgi:hypothetical protein